MNDHETIDFTPEAIRVVDKIREHGGIAGDLADAGDDEYEPCDHDCDEECKDYQGFSACTHQHCMNCGGCGCPGYCDDYQTYNLRPAETGGSPERASG